MSDTKKESVKPIVVTDDTFEELVLKSQLPIVVDFWAEWCGPCKAIAPALDKLSEEFEGQLVVAKIDNDKNKIWAEKYAVQGIPHLIFFNKGEVVKRHIGAAPRARLFNEFDSFLVSIGAKKKDVTPEAQAEFDAIVAGAEAVQEKRQAAAGAVYREKLKTHFDTIAGIQVEYLKALEPTLPAEEATIAKAASADNFDEPTYLLWQKYIDTFYSDDKYAEMRGRLDKAIEELNKPENETFKKQMFAEIDAASIEYDATVESARKRIFG